jgi:hypothetical protein
MQEGEVKIRDRRKGREEKERKRGERARNEGQGRVK